jgi:V/A-type H+-transporting ATPase subunit D
MTYGIRATRSELLTLRKKIRLAERGHRLLKLKRDVLLIELTKRARSAKEIRSRVEDRFHHARESLMTAKLMGGTLGVLLTAISIEKTPEIAEESVLVMGTKVPHFSVNVRKKLLERGYGLITTPSVTDDAVAAYEELTELLVLYAQEAAAIQILTTEIVKLKRRVNALEMKVIPELVAALATIISRMEELEREELSRIFWVKHRKGKYR